MPYPTNNPIDGRTTCTCKQPAAQDAPQAPVEIAAIKQAEGRA